MSRARHGRVLVECCVSIVLLAGGSALVLLMSSTTAMLVDDARQQDLLQRATASRMTAVAAAPCAVAPGVSLIPVGARSILVVTSSASGPTRQLVVEASWQRSALDDRAVHQHTSTSAGWCQ